MISKKITKIIFRQIISFARGTKRLLLFIWCYQYDIGHYLRYSSIFNETNSYRKLCAQISMSYHGIEKGLTMPNRRLGFGKNAILRTANLCTTYINKGFDTNDNQFLHALSVLGEYDELHKQNNHQIDKTIQIKIDHLLKMGFDFPKNQQIETSNTEYFKYNKSDFRLFSLSRYSLRNFQSGVEINLLEKAIELAQKAPSSCNRQASRVHIIQEKRKIEDVLKIQNGNQGFGKLADKILIITAEVGVYASPLEHNAAYVDGGMFGMNLLYALHYYKIGSCTLNSNLLPKQAKKLKYICNIPNSEVLVMIILIGLVPEKIDIAVSKRQDFKKITKIL